MKKRLKRSLATLISICLIFSLFPALTASALPSSTAVFTDGDLDHVYFAGNTISFSLTGLDSIPASTPIRVAFGLLGAGNSFTDTELFSSGLTYSAGYGYYLDTTMSSGGASSAISGTVKNGLGTGAVGVKVYADTDGPGPNGFTNIMTGGVNDFLPLLASGKPALVGFDNVLPAGVTSTPAFSAITNFYSPSLSIRFTKDLGGGNSGSISFTNLNFENSTNLQQLAALDTGLNIAQVGGAAEFNLGIDDTTLSFLASLGATLSLTSPSLFAGKSESDFQVVGEAFNGDLSFDSSTSTVTFSVGHFSDYNVKLLDATAAPNASSVYVTRVSASLINVYYTGVYVANSTVRLYTAATGGSALGSAPVLPDNTATFSNYAVSSSVDTIYVTRQDPSKNESSRTAIPLHRYTLTPSADYTFPDQKPGYMTHQISAKPYTITNTGRTCMTGVSVSYSGGDFIVTQPSSTIALDESSSFTVKPRLGLSEGTYTGSVTIFSDYTASRTVNFTQVIDGTAPVPGASGAITAANVSSSSLTLNWTAAADNYTASSSIKYYVVQSPSANIDTVQNCQTYVSNSSATLLNAGGTDNITSYAVSGLSPSTDYYFNLIVSDSANNYAAYTMLKATTSGSSSSGPAGGGGGSTASVSTSTAGNSTTVSADVKGVPSLLTGISTASIDSGIMSSLAQNALDAERNGKKAVIEINVDTSTSKSAAIQIPAASFNSAASATDASLSITTGIATLSFDSKAVDSISGAAASGDVKISITAVDGSALSQEAKSLVGDRPVYDFSVTAGGSTVSSFGGGSVTVGIPYTPLEGEDPNAIVVYYIDGAGSLKYVQGAYNAATGKVEFTASHFSKYAVGYNKLSFTDVADGAWYCKAVTFISARGITTGTSAGVFSPEQTLSRAQFIVMLMRACGISPDETPSNNFADAGKDYYTNYLSAAKRLGIASGIGDNRFGPELEISRQDMFTLIYRTLGKLGMLPESASARTLSDFRDAGQISDYALTAVRALVESGKISGSGGLIDPFGKSTRAEMAQIIYNLLSK